MLNNEVSRFMPNVQQERHSILKITVSSVHPEDLGGIFNDSPVKGISTELVWIATQEMLLVNRTKQTIAKKTYFILIINVSYK
jgi:hypothetical protein